MTSNDGMNTAGVALVTGATSGIGRATALQLAADGYTVVVHGRDAARGSEVVRQIEEAGASARFVAADLTDPSDVERLAKEAGEVDVLVNNAGLSWFGPTADLDLDTYDRLWDGNVRSAYLLVAALAPGMARRGRGSIISVDSMAGHVGLVGGAAYGASKGCAHCAVAVVGRGVRPVGRAGEHRCSWADLQVRRQRADRGTRQDHTAGPPGPS
jgi:short-subunit dehydrogenase